MNKTGLYEVTEFLVEIIVTISEYMFLITESVYVISMINDNTTEFG
jgi:hypothetical protein